MHNNRNNRETVIIPQTIIVPTKSIIVASLRVGVRKIKNMKESTHIVRRIVPLDETGLVLLDQAMNYLFHTRSKNFYIYFQITWDKRNRSVAGTI